MLKKKSMAINAGMNSIQTICRMIFPLITFPYITRVLGVENIGMYNFCTSVISYFTLIAGLGISTLRLERAQSIVMIVRRCLILHLRYFQSMQLPQ